MSGDWAPQCAMAAAAQAQVPVPEEVVGPTPRSKMRMSISLALIMRRNSTLVWLGNCWMGAEFPAKLGPAAAVGAEIFVVNDDDEVGIAHGNLHAVDERLVGKGDLGGCDCGDAHARGDLDRSCLRRR